MKCRKCGSEMSQNDAFCGVCGAKRPEYRQTNGNYANRPSKTANATHSGGSDPKIYIIIIAAVALLFIGIAAALFGYILYGGAKSDEDSKATEAAITSQESERPTEIAAKYETYYVVNCKSSISLRERPENSAKVISEIPLGTPVSYVEPAQNGFAKIIYNGTTGYALQSYLSNDPDDIKRGAQTPIPNTGNNNTSGSSKGGSQASGAVNNPGFHSYTDNEYNFSCEYPAHFTAANSSSKFVRRSYKAPDNTATVNICATKNSTGLSAKKVQDNFKSSFPGTVDYENIGSDWCVCRMYKDGMYHYGYFSLKNGMIRGFEMHFDGAYYQTYETYVDYIYDSLIMN